MTGLRAFARVFVVAAMVAWALIASNPAQAQFNALSVSSTPGFPGSTVVGAQNQGAQIALTNQSQGSIATASVTVSNIRLNPSCAGFIGSSPDPCSTPDGRPSPGPILSIDSPAIGRAGTACAGILFTVSPPAGTGTVTLNPSAPVVLGPSSGGGSAATCVIDMTFDVLQRPLDGSTVAVVLVSASAPGLGPVDSSGSSSVVVVSPAQPTIVTQASPSIGVEGTNFTDFATVTGVPSGPPPTGTVTFTLFRSTSLAFPDCTGPPFSVSTPVPVAPTTPAQSGAPRATATSSPQGPPSGRYVFVATYDSSDTDVNYAGAVGACGDPNEQFTVQAASPTISVQNSATPLSLPAPGGTFTFTVAVTNMSNAPVTITSVADGVYGNVATIAGSTCGAMIGTTLASGASTQCTFTGTFTGAPGASQTDVVTVTARNAQGFVATDSDDATVTISEVPGSRYVALSPVRIEDTRFGSGGLAGPLGPGATVEVQVTGRAGVPVGATAVVMNVTVTQPTADGYLTLFPAGTTRPLAANVNFSPGKTVPNLAVVKLGTGGKVAMFNSTGTTHVIYDVAGYYTDSGGNAGRFQPLVPARIADTRLGVGGMRLGPGQSFDLQVTGQGGAPVSGVSAAVLNVAVTNTTAPSYLTVFPTGESRPLAANLNFVNGDTVSNRTMTKVGAGGKVTIYNAAGDTDVIVDLGGTYTDASVAGSLGAYTALDPARILDTRIGPPLPANGSIDVQVAGQGGVPATGARAVILNVAVTEPVGFGYLTISPTGTPRPFVADLNYAPLETRANLVVVQLGPDGRVNLFTSSQAHVIFDVAGWLS